jgi:ornithine carbamoyltransferase
MSTTGVRHFTRLADLGRDGVAHVLELAAELKTEDRAYDLLNGRTIAYLFEQPAPRARVSFATAIARLGATPVMLSPHELRLGDEETIADTARELSGWCSAIVVRAASQQTVDELARWATVPVVNAVSDEHDPCHVLADLLTVEESFGSLHRHRLVFVGDGGGAIARSLLEAAPLTGLDLTIVCPPEHSPAPEALVAAQELAADAGSLLSVGHEPVTAVHGADAVYAEAQSGEEFARFQVDARLMNLARPGAIFLHSLPVHRGDEVTAGVVDGPQSVVWQQSANRLPTEEALLVALVRAG